MLGEVAELAVIGRAEACGGRDDAVFGIGPLFNDNLAFAAGLLPAANGFDLDAEGAGRIQQIRAGGYVALPPGGLEDDTMGGVVIGHDLSHW